MAAVCVLLETARAKVNLALHVLGRRSDGYHRLDSIVAFADFGDQLRIEPADRFELVVDGPFADTVPKTEDNLVLRATRALGDAVPPARIVLTKNLPVASGIGGGSADAAAAIRGLLRLAGRPLDFESILPLALKLGADVPVCLASRACRMAGIGEAIEPLPDFAPLHAVLVNPLAPVATAAVFARLGLQSGDNGFASIPSACDLRDCRNDLEAPAMELAPQIAEVLNGLRREPGLNFARMSGSGATCFGIFEHAHAAEAAAQSLAAAHPDWWVVATMLR